MLSGTSMQSQEVIKTKNIYALALLVLAKKTITQKILCFCYASRLLMRGTWFCHQFLHKYTFNQPEKKRRKEMDHVLLSSQHPSCLQDVRTFD